MPTISEAIKAGKKAKPILSPESGAPNEPIATPAPIVTRPATPSPPASPTISGLPIRGIFTPGLILATDFDNAGQEFTKGILLRSKTFPYPVPIVSTLATLEAQAAANITAAKTNAVGATAESASQAANSASEAATSANNNANVALTSASSAQTTATAAQSTANSLNVTPISNMVASGDVDPTQTYFVSQDGSTVIQVVGDTQNLFSYTSTTSSVTITWSSFTLRFADGTSRTVSSGSETVTGLTTSVIYYFYTYVNKGATIVSFVSGGGGSPPVFFSPQNPSAAAEMYARGVTALSAGGVECSPTGGGGGGGGSGLCVRDSMIVHERTKGEIRIDLCKPGDWLLSRDGWTEIKTMRILSQNKFVRVTTELGYLDITATHHITTAEEESKAAYILTLSDLLIGQHKLLPIKSIEFIEEEGRKVTLSCEPEHVFFAGDKHPHTLAHNNVPLS